MTMFPRGRKRSIYLHVWYADAGIEDTTAVWLNTAKDHKRALHRTTKDPWKTAKEHYGIVCRKLALIEISAALYSNAHQGSSKLAYSLQCLFRAPALHENCCTMEIMLSSFDKCAGVSEQSFRKPPWFTKIPKFTKKTKNTKQQKFQKNKQNN